MECLKKLQATVEKELEKLSQKNELSVNEIDAATKALELLEKIRECSDMEMDDPSYSEARYRSPRTGRFVSRDGASRMNTSYGNYGRYGDGNMSHHSIKDRAVAKLEHMMDEADSDYERSMISKMISRIEQDN